MPLLAIDTCFGACSAAVAVNGAVCSSAYEERRTGHAEAIVPMIAHVLAEAGVEARALERIAVTHGPGTFAGIRIGLAAAEGLRLATGAQIVTVSSLWAIGQRALGVAPALLSDLAVAVDAGRSQVYLELLERSGRATHGPALVTFEEAAAHVIASGAGLAGSAALCIARRAGMAVVAEAIEPRAADFAVAAHSLPIADVVRPLYFRPADAVVPAAPARLRA